MPTVDFEVLHTDLKKTQHRLRATKFIDGAVTKEITNEMAPTLLAIAEHFDERLKEIAEHIEDIDSTVQEMVEQSSSFVQPELADAIKPAFFDANTLADAVLSFDPSKGDIELRKLQDLATKLRASVKTAEAAIEEVLVEYVEETDAEGAK